MTTVTINNREQFAVEQRMVVNQLVNNGLFSAGKKMITKGITQFKTGRTMAKAGLPVSGKASSPMLKAGQFSTTKAAKRIGTGAAIGGGVAAGAALKTQGPKGKRKVKESLGVKFKK